VGVVFVLLMNIVQLKKYDWFVIPPSVPHAYIRGELCECMINSDNVVRGGLTPKLKDIDTLLSMLPYTQAW
jgi:mannose-6-phosphate isomerase